MPFGNPFPVTTQAPSAAAAFITKARTHSASLDARDFTPPQAFSTAGGYGARLEDAHRFLGAKAEAHRNLPPKQKLPDAQAQLSDLSRDMFAGVAALADKKGAHSYARAFGVFGLAGRELAVAMSAAGASPGATAVAAGLVGWMSGTAHDAAGADTAAVSHLLERGATKFVQPPGGAQLDENITGDIVKSFNTLLTFGNTISDLGKAGALIATDALVPDQHKGWVTAAVGVVFAATPYLVGQAANQNAVRNLSAAQADAGFSLSSPLRNAAGDQVGNLVVHKEPKTVAGTQEHARLELVDTERGKMHTLALRVGPDEQTGAETRSLSYVHKDNEAIPKSQDYAGRPARTEGDPSALKRTANFVKGALPLISIATSKDPAVTATKTAALGSTLAGSALVRNRARPAIEAWAKTVPALTNGARELNAVGRAVVQALLDGGHNFLLGSDLIPKWNANQRTTVGQVAKDQQDLNIGELSLSRDRGAVRQAMDRLAELLPEGTDTAAAFEVVTDAWEAHQREFDPQRGIAPNAPRNEDSADLTETAGKLAKMARRLQDVSGQGNDAVDRLAKSTKTLSEKTGDVLAARGKVAANARLGVPGGDPRGPTSNFRKIVTAAVPVIGGPIAAGTGQLRKDLPAMTKETFAPYAASKAVSLDLLEQIMQDASLGDAAVRNPLVVRDNRVSLSDGALTWLLRQARVADGAAPAPVPVPAESEEEDEVVTLDIASDPDDPDEVKSNHSDTESSEEFHDALSNDDGDVEMGPRS